MWTIYCHTHAESSRRYVGLTKKTVLQRWNQHVYTASRTNGQTRSHFANAIRAYGKDAFTHEVLETCETLELASERERHWIAFLGTTDPARGFNLKTGGVGEPQGPRRNPWDDPTYRDSVTTATRAHYSTPAARQRMGRIASEAWADPSTRTKMTEATSVAAQQQWSDPEARASASAKTQELWNVTEYREKVVSALNSPDVTSRISATSRERASDPDFRQRLSDSAKAQWSDPFFRDSIQAKAKERWSDPAERDRQRRITADRYRDPEARARQSLAMKEYFRKKRERTDLNADQREAVSECIRR